TDALLASTPVDQWKVYLKWNILKNGTGQLSSPFVYSRFYLKSVLSGQKVQARRNERMSALVDANLGELLGQLYVEKYFTPDAKQRMLNLVNNLQSVYKDRISKLDWMGDDTKRGA